MLLRKDDTTLLVDTSVTIEYYEPFLGPGDGQKPFYSEVCANTTIAVRCWKSRNASGPVNAVVKATVTGEILLDLTL